MMTSKEISFFLNYGYFPNYKPKFKPSKVDEIDLKDKSYTELQKELYFHFKNVIKKTVESIPKNKLIIIPISGGLDSRAILAGVLEVVPVSRVKTYTFGIKGSYDFEIGKKVALKAGVQHDAIELNSIRFTQDELIEIAKKCDYQTHLFHHPPIKKLNELIGDNVVFSGYLGDLIFGSYAEKAKINSNNVKQWYLNSKHYSSYLKNTTANLDFTFFLNKIDSSSIISPAEQMILYERGPKLTAPHILMKGWQYKVPLIDKQILDFIFSLPNEYRIKEKLFIDTMLKYYPKLFNIKAKTTFGYHLKSPKIIQLLERIKNKIIAFLNIKFGFNFTYPPFNYIDFNKEILRRSDLVEIFTSNLQDLENRNILGNIKPMAIYNLHKTNKNLYSILILLVSLEIILKAKEK